VPDCRLLDFSGAALYSQTYLANLRSPKPPTWGQALLASLTLFYVWAALTPLVLWLGRRLPFERHTLRNLVTHLLLCASSALAYLVVANVNTLMRAWSSSYQPQAPLWALLFGLGATNTRERLKHLYNDAHTFNLSSLPGRGVTIRITVPC